MSFWWVVWFVPGYLILQPGTTKISQNMNRKKAVANTYRLCNMKAFIANDTVTAGQRYLEARTWLCHDLKRSHKMVVTSREMGSIFSQPPKALMLMTSRRATKTSTRLLKYQLSVWQHSRMQWAQQQHPLIHLLLKLVRRCGINSAPAFLFSLRYGWDHHAIWYMTKTLIRFPMFICLVLWILAKKVGGSEGHIELCQHK